jgi:hypothetical protein
MSCTPIVLLLAALAAWVQPVPPSPDLERVVGAYRLADGQLIRVLLLREGLVFDHGRGPNRRLQPTANGAFESADGQSLETLVFSGHAASAAMILTLETPVPARVGRRVEVPEDTLRSYAGVYPLSDALAMHVTLEGGRLIVQATGASRHPLFPESPTRFFVQDYGTDDVAGLEFGRAPDGRAFVVMRQAGAEQTVYRR